MGCSDSGITQPLYGKAGTAVKAGWVLANIASLQAYARGRSGLVNPGADKSRSLPAP